ETKRQKLLSDAQAATYNINLKLAMGRTLTDKEKVKANAWLDYVDALNDLDLSTAPEIDWPELPAI
uniref:tail fiber assembly protein n=1 Tax=Phytobacter massiliensis TaxID=1485952 RepID=UPI003BAC55B8